MRETFAYLQDVLGIKYLPASFEASLLKAASAAASPPAPVALGSEPAPLPISAHPSPRPSTGFLAASLEEAEAALAGCTRCKLHKGRKNIVFGEGAAKAQIMFIGEAPGETEDAEGRPFVGPAGELLTKMISAMGLRREEVYIANVVKCRPPMNRNPENDEIRECAPFLTAQIRNVDPKVIVALGTFAAQNILQTDQRISQLRGRTWDLHGGAGSVGACKVIATFHPSYLLRNPSEKKAAWDDLKRAMEILGLKVQ